MKKVLFVCIHNSARSQMAEAYLKKFGKDNFFVESAGLEPGVLNPTVVKVMKEEDIDISNNVTNSVFSYLKEGRTYDYVITVCDEASKERCPLFPGAHSQRLHWSFEDPSINNRNESEQYLQHVRGIRDKIKAKILDFLKKTSLS